MRETFFANGKLLLTGEYVILDGAKGIGIPTKLGQHLTVETINDSNQTITWIAKTHDNTTWLNCKMSSQDFSIISCENQEKAEVLSSILREVKNLNPKIFKHQTSYLFETTLDFPNDWGLGSSSTLLVLLSKFAGISAFDLSQKTLGGSGYDISCGMMPKIQFYQLYKSQRKVNFIHLPDFVKNHCYFVHLNQKQNSREGIKRYHNIPQSKALIKSITDISEKIAKAPDLYEFEDLLYVHESLISNHLQIPTVQEKCFADYESGIVKSLGAWGGDFVLVTAEKDDSLAYFKQKGFNTILSWNELIIES